MREFAAFYFGFGLFAAVITFRYADKRKVSSTFIEGLTHSFLSPGIFLFTVAFWPMFFLNDIFLVIPRESKERLIRLKAELIEARAERLEAREQRLAEQANSVIGLTGFTVTPLRLAGQVRVGDTTWDAISESGFIPSGVPIKVTKQRKREITVRVSNDEEAEQVGGADAEPAV